MAACFIRLKRSGEAPLWSLLRVDARHRLLALLNLFELDADDSKPRDIESVAERLGVLILLAHVAVGIVKCPPPRSLRLPA